MCARSWYRSTQLQGLVVQWLRLCMPKTGGPGSIPGGGTRFHTPQQQQQKIPTCHNIGQRSCHN